MLLLVTLPEVVAAAARHLRRDDDAAAFTARVVTLGVVGGALLAVANPPLGVVAVSVLAVVAGGAALGAHTFGRAVRLEAAATTEQSSYALRWAVALLGASPLAFLLQRVLQT
ncbi:MAG: hypothetical protein GEU74_09810 [Nitriliruptorales bacterium]|nr:hypothetical protein [Nitriliruptorales bacterium]